MNFAMPVSGLWLYASQYGTTAAALLFVNQPSAISRTANDVARFNADSAGFVKSWLLSHNGLLEEQVRTPFSAGIAQRITPSFPYTDESLDWDEVLRERPARPSGKIRVTLKYAGHAKPSRINETWD